MKISSIHSFLIHPGKNLEEPREINGTTVGGTSLLFEMLKRVFDTAEEECQHDIAFVPDEEDEEVTSRRYEPGSRRWVSWAERAVPVAAEIGAPSRKAFDKALTTCCCVPSSSAVATAADAMRTSST